ncbi:MAG TPA: universal stress protein [Jatrophihabitans sp.]|nr:universal stress protein [Jatrophihabitans sp.]
MTRRPDRGRVIVALNDTDGARAALSWSVPEALAGPHRLMLVHVAGPVDLTEWDVGCHRQVLERACSAMLGEAASQVQRRHPELVVETLQTRGDVVETLVDLSEQAELLVLGTTGTGGNLGSVLGSVSQRVAVHARCPVAIVKLGDDAVGHRELGVLVGLSGTGSGLAAIRFAAAEADRRRVRLTALHAGDAISAAVQAELGAARARYHELELRIRRTADEPTQALLQAADHAELLVLGAHHSDDRWSTRLGPVPQSLLHRTGCPMVLVGSSRAVPALIPA